MERAADRGYLRMSLLSGEGEKRAIDMKKANLISFGLLLMVLQLLAIAGVAQDSFGWKGEQFLLNGKPFVIRSGEMHYPRVPRIYWRDRFKMAKAMGLNTITTYVFWNLHEPSKGKFDFSGDLDVAEFVREAQSEGLYVILRPGPYICTEWEFGGIPSWLLAEKGMKVRTSDPRFLAASAAYMKEVGKRLAPLEIAKGGNVIMVQIENEYGSFGSDKDYMHAIERQIRGAGFSGQLFTSDGSLDYMLRNGTLSDALSVINFGVGAKPVEDAEKEFENFARFRQDVPRMVGEYWIGWFDHWGEKRHTVDGRLAAEGLEWMLKRGISFNLYMFHGGTSFGFMNGANYNSKEPYQPDTTSYDYDSPLDEAGRPTPKFQMIRSVILKHLPQGEMLPDIPASRSPIKVPQFKLNETAGMLQLLGRPRSAPSPISMEEAGQSYGFVLYRRKFAKEAEGELRLDVRDYAHIFADNALIGKLDRRSKQNSINIKAKAGSTLDILVENGGRLNFGKDFIYDRKGIIGNVTLNGENLQNWQVFNLPLNDLKRLKFSNARLTPRVPAFYRGTFELQTVGDTFLDTSTWGKGHSWVNGHHLGRYWKIGPQQTLFVPANWLRRGRNEVIVLETDVVSRPVLSGTDHQIFSNQ